MKILSIDSLNKKNAFLLDGIGALISGLFLYFIVGSFESVFGMPAPFAKNLPYTYQAGHTDYE